MGLIKRVLIYPKLKHDFLEKRKKHFQWLFENTDKVCLLSPNHIPEIQKLRIDYEDKILCIGNPNSFQTTALPSDKKKIVLFVGRLDPQEKHPDRLLAIWKKIYKEVPDWNLIFVGDGPDRQRLERMASRLERVTFTGYTDPVPYYKEASILCLTSSFEGFGMVITEAMQFGVVPMVFNSFPTASELIDDGKTGILVPPFNRNKFASKLKYLIANEKLRQDMSQAAFEKVKNYSIESITNQWENLFNNLLTLCKKTPN
jgi:glycosyltransferase involved in cell wall biosynthesis